MNLIACAQIGGPTWEMFDERLVRTGGGAVTRALEEQRR